MSDYGNYGGSSMEAKKQQVMDQVRSELALANAQELINKINEKCFAKCVLKPGSSLDSSEQACLSKCMDRYMEAWNIVSRTYINRVQRESQNMGGAGGF
ncbi:protein translocase subunit [Podila clonocystis]|nr:protein translocase subunit [Podila clonocystis]